MSLISLGIDKKFQDLNLSRFENNFLKGQLIGKIFQRTLPGLIMMGTIWMGITISRVHYQLQLVNCCFVKRNTILYLVVSVYLLTDCVLSGLLFQVLLTWGEEGVHTFIEESLERVHCRTLLWMNQISTFADIWCGVWCHLAVVISQSLYYLYR